MRVGIIGDANRTVAWEKHLRPLSAVTEVVIAPALADAGEVEACLLIDDSKENLARLSEAIRLGVHTYLVSRLPTERKELESIYHYSQEADVHVQFSHWPSIAPATEWMRKQLPKPQTLQVIREQSQIHYTENRPWFTHNWIDEFALITRWMDKPTHRIEGHQITTDGVSLGIQLFLRYDSGATASLYFMTAASENRHKRVVSDGRMLLELDVTEQRVRKIVVNASEELVTESRKFDASRAAEQSAVHFFKAIRLRQPTLFSPYDAMRTAIGIEKVKQLF
ncbi:MAG: hypothetical protein WD529_07445 [Balneolaceae bacterium]